MNKKFKPMDTLPIDHQYFQMASSTASSAPTTSSPSIEQSPVIANNVGVNSRPSHDHLYALAPTDLWSPD